MASLNAKLNITGMDVFAELLAIVRGIVDDPDVPQKHKDWVQAWVQAHQTDYAIDKPIHIRGTDVICPLCGLGKVSHHGLDPR